MPTTFTTKGVSMPQDKQPTGTKHATEGQNELLFEKLQMMFPGMSPQLPQGSGGLRDTYWHVIVCMLEWQGMEDLVGAKRARKAMEWKQHDHYTSIYETVLENREKIETLMQQYRIKF